jgi:hypothetical protein
MNTNAITTRKMLSNRGDQRSLSEVAGFILNFLSLKAATTTR